MKLRAFDTKTLANKGVDIELKDLRTGAGSGVFITVHGSDSDLFRELQSKRSREILDIVKTRGKDYMPSVEESDRSTCEMLAACTVGWRGVEDDNGPWEFSREAAVKLYMEYPRIREQINVAIADAQNFLAG